MSLTDLEKWELKLSAALAEVDRALENKYGTQFTLRPNRPNAGTTGNPKYDGLFTVTAKFTLGLTGKTGPSYIVDIRTSTFQRISDTRRNEMLELAQTVLQTELDRLFPGNLLAVAREGDFLRITGNLGF